MIKLLLAILFITNIYADTQRAFSCDRIGEIRYKNALYTGECKNNKKEGHGVIVYNNGNKYDGSFKEDAKDGFGIYTYVGGESYTGDWRKDVRDGKGIFKYASGSLYEGEFKNNAKNGQGKQTYISGSVYEGSWINNVKEGKGTYVDSTGARYEGSFKNNKKSGQGVLTYVDAKVHDGSWLNGLREGKGTLTYPNGKVFYGSWHKDKREGAGSQVTQYGICQGIWSASKLIKVTNEVNKKETYSYFNSLRGKAGMIPLKTNELLEKSATSHSKYIELHIKELKGLSFHNEREGKKGFSGKNSVERAIYAGYFSRNVSEGISTFCTAQESMNSLMTAIYHRFTILSFDKDEFGVGYTQNPSKLERNFVHNMGNSQLNILCMGESAWIGNYYEKVCADKTLKVKKDPYEEAKSSIQKQNPLYVLWPSASSKNNAYYFENEVPNPIPDFKRTGNPISIEFNPFYFPNAIVMHSFRVYKNAKEVSNTRVLSKQTDPNKKFNAGQYALFPLDVLERNAIYEVEFNYSYNGSSDTIKWSFTTME